jgi:predicted esterase
MALSYPGEFKKLAILSGSWATCAGAACILPESLPEDHPPTLFLHGGLDTTVPLWTMKQYARALEEDGVEVESEVWPLGGHRWFKEEPDKLVSWFVE